MQDVLANRVLAAIRDRALCVPCISKEATVPESTVRETVMNAPVGLAIRGGERICERCNIIRHTYRISIPKPPKADPKKTDKK